MNITPLNHHVLVLKSKTEKEESGSFEITTNKELDLTLVKVLKVSEDVEKITEGKEVYILSDAGRKISIQTEGTYMLVDVSDILAIK